MKRTRAYLEQPVVGRLKRSYVIEGTRDDFGLQAL